MGKKSHYKGYWMMTNRCNLNCSYCVLEDAPHQLKQELDLESKKELLSHLYHLGFRRLTLSGGEVLIMGRRPPADYVEILNHIRQFRTDDPETNLEIEVYTNGTFLNDAVADAMKGVVDQVAVTIDSTNNEFLTQLGRNNTRFPTYYKNIIEVCGRLSKRGIALKLHSVISQKNHDLLYSEIGSIIADLKAADAKVDCWKFYQYMSYDSPQCDQNHAIPREVYEAFCQRAEKALQEQQMEDRIKLHFKDNDEMNASLFNILSYGNAQYMRDGDSWSTSKRTKDLRSYPSMESLFEEHDINKERFHAFHEITQ